MAPLGRNGDSLNLATDNSINLVFLVQGLC